MEVVSVGEDEEREEGEEKERVVKMTAVGKRKSIRNIITLFRLSLIFMCQL